MPPPPAPSPSRRPVTSFLLRVVGWVKQPLKLGVADLKPDYEPGSFGFDPLGLYPKVRHAKVVLMLRVDSST